MRGFREIVDGQHDDLPEQAFIYVGTIEEAVEKGHKIQGKKSTPSAAIEKDKKDEAAEKEDKSRDKKSASAAKGKKNKKDDAARADRKKGE